jgi:putative transposase
MAGKISLGIGVQFLLNGRQFKITKIIDKDLYEAVDLGFKDVSQRFSKRQILEELENKNLRFAEKGKNTTNGKYDFDTIEDFTPDEKRKIEFRKHAIDPLLKINAKSLNEFVLARASMLKLAENENTSRASLYRWLKDFNDSNHDIRSLVSKTYNSGSKESKTSNNVEQVIDSVIDKIYFSEQRYPQKTVYEMVINRVYLENSQRNQNEQLELPSISTVRRRIIARNPSETEKSRKGSKSAWDKFGSVTVQEKPEYPFKRVEVDHSRLDLFVVDEKNRLPIGRPYITTAVDVSDGYPLGIYVGFEPPSYTSVMHVLSHAISPKTYVSRDFPEIKNEWLAYGIPEKLVVDNGKEFHSKHLRDACHELGIVLDHCPVKMPWYKGTVERYFRTINQQLIHQTSGTTFSNIFDKGEYDPQKNAVISFGKLWELLHIWILDYYTQSFNHGIDAIPAKKRQRALEIMEEPLPTYIDDWKIKLMKVGNGTIQRSGLRTNYLSYQSSELAGLKNKLLSNGLANSIKFKYDPTDLSSIYVLDELEKNYFKVTCTNQEYSKGLNEYAHKVIINEIKKEEREVDIKSLAETRAKIMKLVEEESKLTLTEKKKNERIKGTGSNQEIGKNTSKNNEEELQNTKVIKNHKEKDSENDNKVINLFEDFDYKGWGVFNAK